MQHQTQPLVRQQFGTSTEVVEHWLANQRVIASHLNEPVHYGKYQLGKGFVSLGCKPQPNSPVVAVDPNIGRVTCENCLYAYYRQRRRPKR